jgi:alpha-1,6-mannosyltransferase
VGRIAQLGRRVRAARLGVRGAGTPLKVLDLTEFFSPKGGGVRTYLTAKAQWCADRTDVRHVIVVPGPASRVREWYGSRRYDIGGPPVPASPGYHVLARPGALAEILERELPDVIELGSIYSAPWVLRAATTGMRIPQVGFFHMDLVGAAVRTLGRDWPAFARTVTRGTLSTYLRAAYARCWCVVGASAASVDAIRAAGIPHPRFAPFGVDLTTFRPEAADPSWKREVDAIDRPVALYVGRLTIEKNLRVALDALPALHRSLGLKLVLIGEGGWRPHLEAMAARDPHLLAVLPYETDRVRLARAYASADLYIAPSPHETFGIAALEAAACGLPIVGANGGALAERLTGAIWGRTFEPGSTASLGDAVEALLGADPCAARQAAREAASKYGWGRTFETLLGVYREAMAAVQG